MRYLFLILILLLFFSCRKDNDKTSADILMSANWYPYQNEYKVTDSSFIYSVSDPYGTPKISVTTTDSIAAFSDCGQKTLYSFQGAGILIIKNACPVATETTTTWQLSQTNQMSMYSGINGSVYIYGPLTNLSNKQFTLSTTAIAYYYRTVNDGQTASENHRIYTITSTLFKRR